MEKPREPESSIEHPSWWPADVVPGPTPAGGDRSEAQYFDEGGHPCEKDRAVRMLIREVAADGAVLKVTWGDLGGDEGGEGDDRARPEAPPGPSPVPPTGPAPSPSVTWGSVRPAPLPPRRRSPPAFPGFTGEPYRPTVVAEPPVGWFVKESVTLLAPDGQANVICSSEPLEPTIDTDAYAQVQGDLLRREFPGYREVGFERRPIFGDRPGYWREFTWQPPDGVEVYQIQLYWAQPGRGYTATATTPANGAELAPLREVLARLRIDGAEDRPRP